MATTVPLEPAAFRRSLYTLVWQLGKLVPVWVYSPKDLLQIGYLGILSVAAMPHKSAADYRRIQLAAAKRQMIDAIRAVEDLRPGHVRKREFLVDDARKLGDKLQDIQSPEDVWIEEMDLQAFACRLSPRERRILYLLMDGYSLAAIGQREGLTEGRICQLRIEIRKTFQDAALERPCHPGYSADS